MARRHAQGLVHATEVIHAVNTETAALRLTSFFENPFVNRVKRRAPADPRLRSVLDPGACSWQPQPQAHGPFHGRELRTRKLPQVSDQFGVRNRHQALGVKHTRTQEWD
jgi:hypothetical protein